MGRYQVATAITYATLSVSNWLGRNSNYATILNKVNGVLGILTGFSAGGAIAYVLDAVDATGVNQRIQF